MVSCGIIGVRLGKFDCSAWAGERSVCSAPWLAAFAVVCLAYFLLAVFGAHVSAAPTAGHNSVETVHLPRNAGAGKGNVVGATAYDALTSLIGNDAAAQIATADPDALGQHVFDGPGLIAAVATVVAALLAICFPLVRRPAFTAFLAVLGVGRWHRSVVLHL